MGLMPSSGARGRPVVAPTDGKSPRDLPQTHGAFFNVETERGETLVCVSSLTWGAWDPDPFPVGCGSLNAELEWTPADRGERSPARTGGSGDAFGRVVRVGRSRLPVFDRVCVLRMEGLLEPAQSPPVGVFRALPIDDDDGDAGAARAHHPVPVRHWRARLLMERDLLYRVYARLEECHGELRHTVHWKHAEETVDELLRWALSSDARRLEFIAVCAELDAPRASDTVTGNHRVLDMVDLKTLVCATLRVTDPADDGPRARLAVLSPDRPARRAWCPGRVSVSDSRIACRFEPRGDSDAGQLVYVLSPCDADGRDVWCPVAYAANGTDDGCVSCVLLSSLFHPPGIRPLRVQGGAAHPVRASHAEVRGRRGAGAQRHLHPPWLRELRAQPRG